MEEPSFSGEGAELEPAATTRRRTQDAKGATTCWWRYLSGVRFRWYAVLSFGPGPYFVPFLTM